MPGGWWHESETAGRIICDLCPRECNLGNGDRGFCFVRKNDDGQMLLTTYGRSTGFCIDPIEKKPLNHFFPGTSVLSFGTAGCNLGCKFCQNWDISKSREIERLSEQATPEMIATAARTLECRSVAFTYNDPVIWAEYAMDVARACRAEGVKTVAVTAGYISPDARAPFFHTMDAANVDLKGFNEDFYRLITLSHMQPVLDTLCWIKQESDTWLEITNLLIPDENDSDDEMRRMCDWILDNLGDQVPVHFTAFHPDYRMTDKPRTPHETLLRAHELASQQGIQYPYVGNVNDLQHQSTYCPACQQILIERDWYVLGQYQLKDNCCGHCGHTIVGKFDKQPGNWGSRRQPVRIQDYAPATPSTESRPAMASPTKPANSDPNTSFVPLDNNQQQVVHQAACEIIAATLCGRDVQLVDRSLADCTELTVMGSFVTLKRKGQLRACCGVLGKPMPLGEALRQSAISTATRDRRFPPISPTELAHLDVDISLLHNFQPIDVAGQQRADVVQVGHHGLVIRHGERSGLLLPVVAVDNGLDAKSFLRHVCLKAELPETAWLDEDASLQTFEVQYIESPWDPQVSTTVETGQLLSSDTLNQLLRHCQGNIVALVNGATPSYYLPDCPDVMAYGIALQVTVPGEEASYHWARFSPRKAMPLQTTLFQLVELAAAKFTKEAVPTGIVEALEVDLLVLDDPAMHGGLQEADLAGIEQHRAVVMFLGEQNIWSYNSSLSAQQLLDEAIEKAAIQDPAQWQLLSFRSASTCPAYQISNVARPVPGGETRQAAVAGRFYPGSEEELWPLIDTLIGDLPAEKQACPAVMVPHAGLVYSGKLAADVLKEVQIPATVIILSPKHTRLGVPWAVAPCQAWSLPGVTISSDRELAEKLVAQIDGLELDAAAHEQEHGIEVELPLLARLAPESQVVGIAIGEANLEQCKQFGSQLAGVLRGLETQPLLVISSDMNHFATDEVNRQLDALALEALGKLDPDHLFEVVTGNEISMCGLRPAVIVLECLKQLGQLSGCQQIGYTTSADVSGDTSRVVGYAGVTFQA
jgi:AmmeMemoRadiSam system radical SAM enzyme/AmmeMemoRadiSam system protein B/AmmeMemoRadiSam system protein A